MGTKTQAFGAQILYDADGTPPFTALADIKSITPPGAKIAKSDITTLESSSQWREFTASWKSGDDVTFEAYYTKAQFETLEGFYGTTYYWRINFPLISGESTNGFIAFQGFISGHAAGTMNTDDEGSIMATTTITITGPVAHTSGS